MRAPPQFIRATASLGQSHNSRKTDYRLTPRMGSGPNRETIIDGLKFAWNARCTKYVHDCRCTRSRRWRKIWVEQFCCGCWVCPSQ